MTEIFILGWSIPLKIFNSVSHCVCVELGFSITLSLFTEKATGVCHVLTHAHTDYDQCVWQSGWSKTSAHWMDHLCVASCFFGSMDTHRPVRAVSGCGLTRIYYQPSYTQTHTSVCPPLMAYSRRKPVGGLLTVCREEWRFDDCHFDFFHLFKRKVCWNVI